MQIEFRPLNPDIPRNALPGELVVRPSNSSDFDRTDLTRLALERGVAAFVRGQAPITRIIVSDDPSLDDLVAVLVLEAELAGKPLPTDSPWGHYVAVLRGGMRPNRNLPIEDSLEGLFAMIRQEAGDPLTDPLTAA